MSSIDPKNFEVIERCIQEIEGMSDKDIAAAKEALLDEMSRFDHGLTIAQLLEGVNNTSSVAVCAYLDRIEDLMVEALGVSVRICPEKRNRPSDICHAFLFGIIQFTLFTIKREKEFLNGKDS